MQNMKKVALAVARPVIAGLGALTYYQCQREIRQERERVATGSQIVETACGPIEYAVIGEGPPVLAVHGAGGGYDQGLDLAGPLAEKGFRVIAMSRFGYLRTPLPADASAEAQADAHACLLDALNIERAAVVGASAGGPSSMQFALRHPERCTALALLVPLAYAPRPAGEPPITPSATRQFLADTALRSDFLFWLAAKVARRTFIRAILGTPPELVERANADEQAQVLRMLHHILPVSQRRQGLLNEAAIASSLPRYDLERITAPTLVISMADDLYGTFEGSRYTAEHIPGARFIGYTTGGHMGVGHSTEISSEIAAFLAACYAL